MTSMSLSLGFLLPETVAGAGLGYSTLRPCPDRVSALRRRLAGKQEDMWHYQKRIDMERGASEI